MLCALIISSTMSVPYAAPCRDPRCAEIKGVAQGAMLQQAEAGSFDKPGIFAVLPPHNWISFEGGELLEFCMEAKPPAG